ncbi:MAG TPA: PhzF family phenazine biosynthesis protein [Vitreimonas sp.]|uniref:PhzF family phenazine biosynthesis protein n=1 Tax=Vitreimonas sp. TaxID=3069702 RepID=UPI002D2FCFD4|nr:PhzF family phenazine biosynthesis protein [Vitreimonas sp.]HYD88599.1 PhzF family phenazine biosynthesis protein [Vitreimonas sp.]
MQLSYATYDVFTDTRFAGNPLAVVFDADDLSDAQMQTIAREFNLSETIFVRAPDYAQHEASVRIFTPTKELPFAGHPTIGCAIALAERRHANATADLILVLEERVGPVRCGVKLDPDGASFAEFTAPKLSAPAGADPTPEACAAALGLAAAEIGFGRHTPSLFSAGVPFVMIPVADTGTLGRAKLTSSETSEALGATEVFVYTRAERAADHAFRARMFAPEIGIVEDPATGGAAAAFAGVLARFEDLPDGWHTLPILQGVEMGRPSLIGLEVEIARTGLTGVRIAGKAVKVSEGVLFC